MGVFGNLFGGGGGTKSKSTISQLSQTITNVTMNNVNQCQVSTSQNQNTTINNSGFSLWGNYHLEQTSTIDSKCWSDAQLQAKIQNDIVNAISQSSTADGIALLSAFGNTSATAKVNLTNIIQNNITMNTIQQNYNNIQQNQSLTVNNSGVQIFQQVDLTQGAKIFAAATLQTLDNAGVFNTISNYVDQSSKSQEKNPLGFITDFLGNIASSFIFVFMFIILIIAAIIFASRRSGPPPVHVKD